MRYGIITDIHNNVTALRAVMKQLEQRNCDRIICCGDMIGIGPDPEESVQEILRIPRLIAVRGNHESYLLEGMPTECPNEEHMSLEEMETFIYWVYMNGNLDGQYSHEDSPYTSYFGGQLLKSKSSEIPESIDDLWRIYEENKKYYESKYG